MVSESDRRLLRVLLEQLKHGRPPTVSELASWVGVSAALASRRLSELQSQGLVERREAVTARGRVVYYEPRESLEIQWVSPEDHIAVSWSSTGEVDWEFPLTSQIPDVPARLTVVAFLRRLRERGFLHRGKIGAEEAGKARRVAHAGLTVVAFGSAARGSSRPGSDIDVLTIQAVEQPGMERLLGDVAAEVSLGSPRPIQLQHATVEGVADFHEGLRESLQREGLIVWDTLGQGAWSFFYGARR